MSSGTLLDKVWESHTVEVMPKGLYKIFIGRHLVHEVTSAPAFDLLRKNGLKVPYPHLTFATVDHIVPTTKAERRLALVDTVAQQMVDALKTNCEEFGITFFGMDNEHQGIVHVIGPELGITVPGSTVVCGDSHTSTHGAFGAVAFGIGTTQAYNVLGTQCLQIKKPKVRRILVVGKLGRYVYAKDVILAIIRKLGVNGGKNFAYEYAGPVIERMDMEARMTISNMSIECGATCGYMNPDWTTLSYLHGRNYIPKDRDTLSTFNNWALSQASSSVATYDDNVVIDGSTITPMITWGTNPGQVIGVDENIPEDADPEALEYMNLKAGAPIKGTKVNYAFIGSCTNGRISDLRVAASLILCNGLKVAPGVKAIVVPGSQQVTKQAVEEGLDVTFRDAGFEWRESGCSSCLGMNPDIVPAGHFSISSSNRNFQGRQGPGARTALGSPALVAACAAAGEIVDIRELA